MNLPCKVVPDSHFSGQVRTGTESVWAVSPLWVLKEMKTGLPFKQDCYWWDFQWGGYFKHSFLTIAVLLGMCVCLVSTSLTKWVDRRCLATGMILVLKGCWDWVCPDHSRAWMTCPLTCHPPADLLLVGEGPARSLCSPPCRAHVESICSFRLGTHAEFKQAEEYLCDPSVSSHILQSSRDWLNWQD